jgi:hypothetical protein
MTLLRVPPADGLTSKCSQFPDVKDNEPVAVLRTSVVLNVTGKLFVLEVVFVVVRYLNPIVRLPLFAVELQIA